MKNDERDLKITLTPLAPYFFGGRKRTEAEKETDYFLRSLTFPPQTSIVGMVRHSLLIQNNLMPLHDNREKAAKLIGPESFNPESKDPQDFGALSALSPVFLEREGKNYYPCYRLNELTLSKKNGGKVFRFPGSHRTELPHLEGFDHKQGLPFYLMAADGEKLEFDDVFKPFERVGIKKGESGQTEEKGYYKQICYRLENTGFGFYLRLKTEVEGHGKVTFADSLISMGGERSMFSLKVEELEPLAEGKSFDNRFTAPCPNLESKEEYIVLHSQAFLDPALLDQCFFAISSPEFFRNIRTKVGKTKKFYNLVDPNRIDRKNKEEVLEKNPFLSGKHNLLSRGSILFPGADDLHQQIQEYLQHHPAHKIGFNYFNIHPSGSPEKQSEDQHV
jgi:CRISPR type III-B/RAMP module-associated protein Cmr3